MIERCRICRFWQLDLRVNGADPGEQADAGFGWCRREPPQIIDHVARMSIQPPVFGGNEVDRDDVAPAVRVEHASMFPATFGTNWCGRFEAGHD